MRRPHIRRASLLLLVIGLLEGCASSVYAPNVRRREQIETEIRSLGLGERPTIEAQRAEVEAAVAQEDDSPVIDGFEFRASTVRENDQKMEMRARLPFDNIFGASATREARRAATQEQLARLAEMTLIERVRLCEPSLEHLVHDERTKIYDRYSGRQRLLLERNDELKQAGTLDEVRALSFDLSGHVDLTLAEPEPPLVDLPDDAMQKLLAVLPQPALGIQELASTPEIVHEQLRRHQPAIEVHQARGRRFEALARSESKRRLPTLKFVDFAAEPIPYPDAERQYEVQASFEIPFGRAARASEKRYAALARGQKSAERALILERGEQARAAIETVNRFRRRGAHWLDILARADRAEEVADRWWESRQADPKSIARLLQQVHGARLAVLEARQRAGQAACTILASTGASIEEWPQ